MKKNSRLVYSTAGGRSCPACGSPLAACTCKQKQAILGDGVVRIQRQTKGRKGKGVSIITGLPLSQDELSALARSLKKKCGTGGTVKEGTIEIQGDYRDKLKKELESLGYNAKLAGG